MMDGKTITPKLLMYEDVVGAGKQVKVYVDQEVPCVEFTMKRDHFQSCVKTCDAPYIVFTEPFVQFQPQSWANMQEEIMREMVDLWNAKHGDRKMYLTAKIVEHVTEKWDSIKGVIVAMHDAGEPCEFSIDIKLYEYVAAIEKECSKGTVEQLEATLRALK